MTRPTWLRVRSDARKFGVTLLGVLATAAAIADQASGTGVLPEPYAAWAPVLVAVATAAGVYKAKNAGTLAGRDLEADRDAHFVEGYDEAVRVNRALAGIAGDPSQPPGRPCRCSTCEPVPAAERACLPEPRHRAAPPQQRGPSHL